jgi:tetratricopeptide (TPR) repeat protein
MLDVVDEVVAQRPDAVLLYAGHNEYYGALGVGSTQGRVGAAPALVRGYLRLLRLRSVLLVRDGLARVRRAAGARPGADAGEASFMESLAREQEIALGGATYARGLRQYEENLTRLVRRLRAAGVPVLVGSVASNLRDQRPFAAAANRRGAGADAVFDSARAALARRDSGAARALFTRAHDLDVVRFRAPTAFDHVVRRVAAATGATYVPVREAFAAASPGGIAGEELFLEHVHPTRRGHVLLARAYFEALVRSGGLARTARLERLRTWAAYEQAMALTPFDERIAAHTVATLRERWPFVPADRQGDYRARHRAHGTVDSLALLVSRGAPWAATKLQLAQHFLSLGHADSAAAELRGLVRDAPLAEEPRRLLAGALLAGGDSAGAVAALEEAWAVRPTAATATLLGAVALQRRDLPRAIAELRRSLALEPDRPAVLYQLSLAYGLARDLEGARTTALRVAQLDPRHPGLPGWMQAIGLRP